VDNFPSWDEAITGSPVYGRKKKTGKFIVCVFKAILATVYIVLPRPEGLGFEM
jgi:hypothetical protein